MCPIKVASLPFLNEKGKGQITVRDTKIIYISAMKLTRTELLTLPSFLVSLSGSGNEDLGICSNSLKLLHLLDIPYDNFWQAIAGLNSTWQTQLL